MVEPIKLSFRPGINRDVTPYSAMGDFIDGNLVRFVKGFPQSLRGWQRYTTRPMLGTPRGIFPFVTLDGTRLYAVGTTNKYYILNGEEMYDITPVVRTAALANNPFETVVASPRVIVTHVAHGAGPGDYVTFTGAVMAGGITAARLNTEHAIAEVIDANHYAIILPVAAGSTVAGGGGAAVTADYQLPIGENTTVAGFGWGSGPYSRGGYGEPTQTIQGLRLWSQDRFGEDLVINPRDEQIFYYDVSAGLEDRMVPLASLPGAALVPEVARQVILSDADRHIIALGVNGYTDGTQDPLYIRWCNREDVANWQPSTTTTAGGLRLDAGSEIVVGVKHTDAIMIFTDTSLHAMRYVGAPYVFGQVKVADNVHIIGPNGAVAVGTDLYFMGISKFHLFNGSVVDIPCTIESFIFEILNFAERDKVWAGYNSVNGEVVWLLPVNGSSELNFYVLYNPVDGTWAYGSYGDVGRTSWLDVMYEQYPLVTATDGYVYMHEIGATDGTVVPPGMLDSWVKAAPLEIGMGDDFMKCSRIIPDVNFNGSTGDNPTVEITIEMVDAPGVAPRSTQRSTNVKQLPRDVTFPVAQHTAKKDLKLRGRAMQYKIAAVTPGTFWAQGTHRLYAAPDGKR